jgi:ParB/RepB/Spo0J family partition protein
MDLQIGNRVEVVSGSYTGRIGTITKFCSSVFPDHCRVTLDLKPRQRTQETNRMIEMIHLKKIAMSTEFKTIALKEIRPDENQPRKFYEETAMQELISSVKEKGVLQPILIRPNGKGYILVCGERRYRASKEAGLEEIPAVIRQLSDEEALELQIIENLQRKDVHPMEEAVAFKSLVENRNRPLSFEEVAAKVGKSVFYVRQRMKLNSLSKEWQELFYSNKISTVAALSVGLLAEKEQGELYKSVVQKNRLKDPEYKVLIQSYQIEKLQGKLKGAAFNMNDEKLIPKVGACTNCTFNSAVASLFPEQAQDPVCSNATCFNQKLDAAFKIKLEEVKEDPSIVLVLSYCGYGVDKNEALLKQLAKDGHKVYQLGWDEEYDETTSAIKERLKTGKVLKAFAVNGSRKGQFLYVEKNRKTSSSSSSKKTGAKVSAPGVDDINDEIKRIQDREKRSKELDGEKVWTKVRGLLNDKASRKAIFNTGKLSQEEMEALAKAISNKVGFNNDHWIKEQFGSKDWTGVTEIGLNSLFRIFIAEVLASAYGSHVRKGSDQSYAYSMIKAYSSSQVSIIELEQQEAATKRADRVAKRLAQLKAQKKELQDKLLQAALKPKSKTAKAK